MSEHGTNNLTEVKLQACYQTVDTLEANLAQRSRELYQQVNYNCIVLCIGLAMGFIVGKWMVKSSK